MYGTCDCLKNCVDLIESAFDIYMMIYDKNEVILSNQDTKLNDGKSTIHNNKSINNFLNEVNIAKKDDNQKIYNKNQTKDKINDENSIISQPKNNNLF